MKIPNLLVAMLFFWFISLTVFTFAQTAKVEIIEKFGEKTKLEKTEKIIQFDEGTEIPEGFMLLAKGEFKTGPLTVKCGERLMIKKTEEKAREIGAKGFSFYELKEPDNVLNTCYRSKILYFFKL